jgi:hypothetical protein
MRIVALIPGKLLRLRGSLGPLQSMGVDAALSFTLTSRNNGTDITVDYAVGGYSNCRGRSTGCWGNNCSH